MPEYRYQFCDLWTDDHVAWIDDLQDVTFERRISEPGAFSAMIPIKGRASADRAALVVPRQPGDISTGPGRTVCHVWRGDELWGTYALWHAQPAGDERGRVRIALQGSSLESWLYRRLVAQDWGSVDDVDLLEAARMIVRRAQGEDLVAQPPQIDIGITTPGTETAGVSVTREYLARDFMTHGEQLDALADSETGFEWMIRPIAAGRERRFEARVHLGDPDAEHPISQPGDVLGWTHDIDATQAGTHWRARGVSDPDVSGGAFISAAIFTFDYLNAGWPVLSRTESSSWRVGNNVVGGVGPWVRWLRDNRSGASRIPRPTIRMRERAQLTPEHLGDPVRLTLVNDWWPLNSDGTPSLTESWRLLGMSVQPPQRGRPEIAELTLEDPTQRLDPGPLASSGAPQYRPDPARDAWRVSSGIRQSVTVGSRQW